MYITTYNKFCMSFPVLRQLISLRKPKLYVFRIHISYVYIGKSSINPKSKHFHNPYKNQVYIIKQSNHTIITTIFELYAWHRVAFYSLRVMLIIAQVCTIAQHNSFVDYFSNLFYIFICSFSFHLLLTQLCFIVTARCTYWGNPKQSIACSIEPFCFPHG